MRCLSIAFLFVASTAAAENWQQIGTLDAGGGVLFVDASDIVDVKGYRRAWFKSAHEADQPVPNEYRAAVGDAKSYRWVRSAYLFHCAQKVFALAELRWFNSDDVDVGNRRPESLSFRKVSSGTVEEQMLEAVCSSESVRTREPLEEQAKMTRPVSPRDYYPEGSVRRGEQGSPTVRVCVDSTGELLRAPVITVSSGYPELDGAAIRIAKESRYAPGTRNGVALPESCLEVPVAFVQRKHRPR
jgi:TonB family protein